MTDHKLLENYGIRVYPEYLAKDVYKNGKLAYFGKHWYISVNNNGKIIRYEKPIKKGTILHGLELQKPIENTIRHWAQKIEKLKTP